MLNPGLDQSSLGYGVEDIPAHQKWAIDQLATNSKRKVVETATQLALGGMSLSQQAQEQETQQAAQIALQLAEKTRGMADEEFNKYASSLGQTMGAPPKKRSAEKASPNPAEHIGAAIAGLFDPGNAAFYASVPHSSAQERQKRRQAEIDQEYESEIANYNARVNRDKFFLDNASDSRKLAHEDYNKALGEVGQTERTKITQEELTKRNELTNATRRLGFEAQDDREWLKTVMSKTSEGRFQAAIERGYSVDDARRISQATPDELAKLAGAALTKQRTQNAKQLYDFNTLMNPVRIRVQEATEKALLALVPLRAAQTEHSLEDVQRIRAMTQKINMETSLLDDEFALKAWKYKADYELAKQKGIKDEVSLGGAISVYDDQIKELDTDLSEASKRLASLAKQNENAEYKSQEEIDLEAEIKTMRERKDWAQKEKTKLEAELAKQPVKINVSAGATTGGAGGFVPLKVPGNANAKALSAAERAGNQRAIKKGFAPALGTPVPRNTPIKKKTPEDVLKAGGAKIGG